LKGHQTAPGLSTTAALRGSSSIAGPANGPVLAGEVIPYRSGLEGRAAGLGGNPDASTAIGSMLPQKQPLLTSSSSPGGSNSSHSSSSSSHSRSSDVGGHVPQGAVSGSVCSTSALLACLTAGAAAEHMPPCIIMSRWVEAVCGPAV
jgi:hypothetical protein